MTSSYTFTVPVVPRGKGVVRHDPRRAGFFTFKDKDTENYMAAIATCAAPVLGGVLLDGPLRIDVVAVFPRTKELLRLHGRGPNKGLHVHGVRRSWAPRKPDKDNIEKALYDALKPWLPDDCKVVCGDTPKVYCAIGEAPHLEVRISAAPAVDDYFDDHGLPLPYSVPVAVTSCDGGFEARIPEIMCGVATPGVVSGREVGMLPKASEGKP